MYLSFTLEEMKSVLIENGYVAKGKTMVKKGGVSYLLEDAFRRLIKLTLTSGAGEQGEPGPPGEQGESGSTNGYFPVGW